MYKEMSEMMYYYILKAEMVFLRQYKINPFDVIKGLEYIPQDTSDRRRERTEEVWWK